MCSLAFKIILILQVSESIKPCFGRGPEYAGSNREFHSTQDALTEKSVSDSFWGCKDIIFW